MTCSLPGGSILNDVKSSLLTPQKHWIRTEILSPQCPVPKLSGIYAWYFKEIPPQVPTGDCNCLNGLTLLYVGISPKAPPVNGLHLSKENLFKRVRYHMRGNAEGSTLRLTLGCLLKDELGIQLRRVGSGKTRTFASGEQLLSLWMSENAYVVWCPCDEPWAHESQIIKEYSLPLNIQHNSHNPFYQQLKTIRSEAKRVADSLPIIPR